MRQIISTALVAVIVSLLTVTAMGVLALDEPATTERTIMPAAGINAASVDGKSAVGYTSKKTLRRYKLVATGGAGMLPSNIVRPFWGLIRNKPGILADNQMSWDEVKNKPAGFADGVDNKGITGSIIMQVAGRGAESGERHLGGRGDLPSGRCRHRWRSHGGPGQRHAEVLSDCA